MPRSKTLAAALATAATLAAAPAADGCTRFIYESGTGNHLVGRSMDWYEDTQSDIWAYPAGIARGAAMGARAFTWTSTYGSVVTTIYDMAAIDGMNEAGLVVSALYLAETDYGDPETSGLPHIHVGDLVQFMLDAHGTVAELVATFRDLPFAVVAPPLPNGKEATGHFAVADATGDSAIIEFLDGAPVVHHDSSYRVMTNSPTYDQQLAINTYWDTVGGLAMLPGTHRAADRFARISWNLNATPRFDDPDAALAATFSLIRAVSVPLGITDPERPNIASTIWRTVADIGARRYYFDSAFSPTLLWVDMAQLDLTAGAPVMKLELQTDALLAGEMSTAFEPAEMLTPSLE